MAKRRVSRVETEVQKRKDGEVILELRGIVDVHTSPAVKTKILELLRSRPDRLVVVLGEVKYMDSSGIATLAVALRETRRYGGKVVLISPSEQVRGVIRVTRMDQLFPIYGSLDEALST